MEVIVKVKKEKVLKAAMVQLIGIIMARCMILSFNPLCIGYFAALYSKKRNRIITMILMTISMFSCTDFVSAIKYSMIILTISFVFKLTEASDKEVKPYTFAGFTFVVMLIFESLGTLMDGVLANSFNDNIIRILAVTVLGAASSIIFSKGLDGVFNDSGTKQSMEEIVGCVIMSGIAVYYVGTASLLPAPILRGILYLVVLFAGNRYGAGNGAITGNVCGIIFSMWTGSIYNVGIMSALGCISGVFRKCGRILNAIVYAFSACVMEYICSGTFTPEATVQGILIGGIIFILLPSSFTTSEDEVDAKARESALKREGENRLKLIEESFEKLAQSFSVVPRKQQLSECDLDHITREMSGKICADCSKCRLCAVQQDIQLEMKKLVTMADRKGKLSLQDMSGRFMMNCLSPEIFINELNHMFEKARINMVWGNKLIESREVIALQLRQIAGMVGEYGKMLYEPASDDVNEEKLRRGLKHERILLKKYSILENKNHQKEYMITARCMKGTAVNARDMAQIVGKSLGIALEPSINGRRILGNEYATLTFTEKKNFYAMHGTARCTKRESDISGDNFTFSEIGNGQLLMSIADGMGSGYYAFQDSETAIELLEQLMDSGFSEEMALKMINSVMLLNSDSEKPTTLDMGILNLSSGVCDFVKLGAASTFVKRGNWVEAIKSTTMPMGVFGQVDIESTSKKMYSGDMIIMVSDGIVEAINAEDKEKVMSEIIMGIKSANPKEMASLILENVLKYNSNKADDDMTVLVTGIWNKAA